MQVKLVRKGQKASVRVRTGGIGFVRREMEEDSLIISTGEDVLCVPKKQVLKAFRDAGLKL